MDADVQRIYDFVLRQEQKHLEKLKASEGFTDTSTITRIACYQRVRYFIEDMRRDNHVG